MNPNEYLFPKRTTRRDFLALAGASAAGLLVTSTSRAAAPVTFGSGKQTYTLEENWGKLPDGMKYGLGCAVVVDSQDRVYVTSRSENPCVAVFDKDGKLIETWSEDFAEKIGYTTKQVAGTAHGLYCSKEGNEEFFYFTENAPGNRVYKTDLKGKILYTLGTNITDGAASQKFAFKNPTDVAVAPNGDIYIVDGYGSQLLHRFDKNFKHIKTIGGPGKDHGKFNTCHGVWVSTLGKEPELYIADRANDRLEVFNLELAYKRTITGVRKPCCFYQYDGFLFVPELDARVTIVDGSDKIVAHLGDGAKLKGPERPQTASVFAAPHALTLDSKGNLYVVEWVPFGRVRKLAYTPA